MEKGDDKGEPGEGRLMRVRKEKNRNGEKGREERNEV